MVLWRSCGRPQAYNFTPPPKHNGLNYKKLIKVIYTINGLVEELWRSCGGVLRKYFENYLGIFLTYTFLRKIT